MRNAVLSFCIVLTLFFGPLDHSQAQTETASLQNWNPEFEQGGANWRRYGTTSILTRNWDARATFPTTYLGQNYLNWNVAIIEQIGSFEQWVPVDATAKFHIASIEAARYQRPNSPTTNGNATFGITYYDSMFKDLRTVTRQIYELGPNAPGLIASGIQFYSVGGVVPPTAAWAKMWVRNALATDNLVFDSFYLAKYDNTSNLMRDIYFKPPVASGPPLPVVAKGDYKTFFQSNLPRTSSTAPNTEFKFWTGGTNLTTYYAIGFGSALQNAVYYQPLQVTAGRTYEITFDTYQSLANQATAGVEYYDLTRAKIGQVSKPVAVKATLADIGLNGTIPTNTLRFSIPADAVNATFWIYTNKSSDNYFSRFKMVEIP